jgi:hypothetical protein
MGTHIRPIMSDAGRFPTWQSESARVYAPQGPETPPTTIELAIADATNEGAPLPRSEPENRSILTCIRSSMMPDVVGMALKIREFGEHIPLSAKVLELPPDAIPRV